MARERQGLLTKLQIEVLKLRQHGLNQEGIASRLGTTRQNISLIERRGWRNIKLAEETILAYERLFTAGSVELRPGTHKIDIPRLVVDAADKVNIQLKANFARIYEEIKFKASGCVSETRVVKPIIVLILEDGDIKIIPGGEFKED